MCIVQACRDSCVTFCVPHCVCVNACMFPKLHIVMCADVRKSEMLLHAYCCFPISCRGALIFVPHRGMAMQCEKACHAPLHVLMVHPDQVGCLQGSGHDNDDIRAAKISEDSWGWRQSMLNGTLLGPRGGIGKHSGSWPCCAD